MTPGRPARADALRALTADPDAQAAVQARTGPVPADIRAWLDDLELLIGVPLTYLVPDARLLPPKSVRFFVPDPNWVAALVDGALAVAATSAPTAAAVAMAGPDLRGHDVPAAGDATASPLLYSGMLLRSAAVTDWPGLRVAGFEDVAATVPLSIARIERVAPGTLLVLFSGLVQRVDITEPPQHLHLGVDWGAPPTVPLRWIDPDRAGSPVGGAPCPVTLRADPERSVVDVGATVSAIKQALTTAYQPQPLPPFGSAALALQLSQGTQTQPFETGATP